MNKRIRTKGHYRLVERDEKGRFVKAEKWSSKIQKCHYSGMAINPECFECNGLDTECAGYTTKADQNE